jgi:hypothetical protein
MQETFVAAHIPSSAAIVSRRTRARAVFFEGSSTVLEFVTGVTILYTPHKLRFTIAPTNLETEESRNTMKNTWLRFAAAAAIAGGMLLSAQEVNSQPAPPACNSIAGTMAARASPNT